MSKNFTELSKIIDEKIETVLSERFARYSKHIIQERALPDVRDGLKPVQRRILYSMYKEKNTSDNIFRKSAKAVGNIIGNYHPHGDQSVYEAMVRLSQDWKMREPLVDMHGNNGSIDNDPPAAMRYTEARLSKIAETLLRDLDKQTVDFVYNFDDTETEPIVLPSRFPNILVNGSTGISAGYATDIPPHNIEEIISGTVYRLKHPLCSLDDIMKIVQGPDFPTGGIVQGIEGIKSAFETGRGKVVIRCKYEYDDKKSQIVITEIPYEVNKSTLLKKMEDIRIEKILDDLEEVRDESDKDGLRIALDVKKDANKDLIVNYLLKNTELKINYNYNMIVIHNKHPKQMGILSIMDAYIEHQKEVVLNRSNYELTKSRKRLHILEGLIKMVSILDEVIHTIRASKNKADSKENIIAKFGFTQEQAEAIVTLQLYRLSSTDVAVLIEESDELTKYIAELLEIINNELILVQVIIKEMEDIKKIYKSPRRTEIQQNIEEIQIEKIEMIKSEEVLFNITRQGYIRALRAKPNEQIQIDSSSLTTKDYIIGNLMVNTLDKLLIFTNKGNYALLNVHQIEIVKNEFKQHLNDFIRIEPDEFIVKVIQVSNFEDSKQIILATKEGYIKRTNLIEFNTSRNNKTYTAINLKSEDDALLNVYLSDDKDREVLLITKQGYINKYDESQVPIIGLKAAGVKSINLKENDVVVAFVYIYNDNYDLVLLTQRGNIKKIKHQDIDFSVRTNRGQMTLKSLKKNSHEYIGAVLVDNNDNFMVEIDEAFDLIKNNINSYSEIPSNGKLYEKFNENINLKSVIELSTNKSVNFTPKVINRPTTKVNKEEKVKQIEFDLDNFSDK
ncbi:MAG: parC [Haloplasmataceae bacterium]|jgi:topoisomerase-4 subunit A|nr:parC [Haloplasmataceae bacterium]